MAEMEQAMRIAEQALAAIPGGPINVDFEGRPIDPAAYVDQGKQGKTEGLLLVPITLSPNLGGQDRKALERVNAHDKRVVLPPKETAYGSIEGLMNHFMLIMEGYGIRPPQGEAYFASEGANGELGFYIVSDGGDRPYRVRCRPPCLPPIAAVCHNLSRHLAGAQDILRHLEARLGVQRGETTEDGRVTLQAVECLCACEAAPMMQVDDRYEMNLTPDKCDRILRDLR